MAEKTNLSLVPANKVASAILIVRGQRVLLDRDLAALYGVETRVLNQAVRRKSELKYSKSVLAFTEHGIAMLSSVLNSPRAVRVNIEIMRAFVRLRAMLV